MAEGQAGHKHKPDAAMEACLAPGIPSAAVPSFFIHFCAVVWVLQKWPSQGDHPSSGDLAVQRGEFWGLGASAVSPVFCHSWGIASPARSCLFGGGTFPTSHSWHWWNPGNDTAGSCLAQGPPHCLMSSAPVPSFAPGVPWNPFSPPRGGEQRWNLPFLPTGSPGAAGDGQSREVGVPGGAGGSPALLRGVV